MNTEPARLRKGLSTLHVFAIASGAMISSGLFILPGMAHATAGPGAVWSYLLAGVLATAGALSIAELTTAMPKAGGDYFFITRGFGPGVGTVAGILSWFSLSLKSAFAIVGMSTFPAMLVHLHGAIGGHHPVFVLDRLVAWRRVGHGQTRESCRAGAAAPRDGPKGDRLLVSHGHRRSPSRGRREKE